MEGKEQEGEGGQVETVLVILESWNICQSCVNIFYAKWKIATIKNIRLKDLLVLKRLANLRY